MILNGLNTIELPIAFDCNDDGVPDDISIFKEASQTGCCRLLPVKSQRTKRAKSGRRKR